MFDLSGTFVPGNLDILQTLSIKSCSVLGKGNETKSVHKLGHWGTERPGDYGEGDLSEADKQTEVEDWGTHHKFLDKVTESSNDAVGTLQNNKLKCARK